MSNKVVCRLCQKEFGQLSTHLHFKHDMNVEQYKEKFQGAKTVSDEVHNTISSGVSKSLADPVKRSERTAAIKKTVCSDEFREEHSKLMKQVMSNPEIKEKMKRPKSAEHREKIKAARIEFWSSEENREMMKEIQSSPEHRSVMRDVAAKRLSDPEFINRLSAGVKNSRTPDFLDKQSKRMIESWKNPDFRSRTVAGMKESWLIRDWGIVSDYERRDGVVITVRSSWELHYAKMFDELGINWLYEPKRFKLDGHKTYLPDFFLVDDNLWIEVKGRMDDISKYKINRFQEIYLTEKLIVLESCISIDEFEILLTNTVEHNAGNQQPSLVRNDQEGSETRREQPKEKSKAMSLPRKQNTQKGLSDDIVRTI